MDRIDLPSSDPAFTRSTKERGDALLHEHEARDLRLDAKYLVQMAHLTTPATVWKYVESACTKSSASLVMLDLEDSIPRGNDDLLRQGRENVVRAFTALDWGKRLRFFRPRGLALDPGHEDVQVIVGACGDRIDGLIYPKVETASEVALLDATLTEVERRHKLPAGKIKIEVLIESASAEEQVFEIARSSKRIAGLIFGAFDYWGSLRMIGVPYRTDHPLVDHARARIVKAAASVGVPAIAEMTLNYPTKEKSDAEKRAALDECRRDAVHAKDFGFRGKWTGIPAQTEIALDVFSIADDVVKKAVEEAKLFLAAEREGRGATMIDGKMQIGRRIGINRVALQTAYVLGRLDETTAHELGIR